MSDTHHLFVDLYAYRQREKRNPLEDWLTECLAATIRALPGKQKGALLTRLSGTRIDDPQRFSAAHRIEVITQYPAGEAGRPDMLILLDGQPWILFENKVSHGVSVHTDEDGTQSHQLRRYAGWLSDRGKHCALAPAIVFVTHITPPPEDFRKRDATGLYRGLFPTHTSWGALGREISKLVADLPQDHHASVLASAFLTFLEENNMSNEFPPSSAFAAAELYVTQAETLENLVDRMWHQVRSIASFGKTADYQLKALTDEGSVSAWRYVAPGPASPDRSSYLQTGIWYPEAGLWFDAEDIGRDLRGAHAYLFFGNNSDGMFSAVTEELAGFVRPTSDFLAMKAIADFSSDPQSRGEEIISWIADRSRVLKTCLTAHQLIA
ncbi:hypothetical protein FHR20_000081 [Sphingomonas leidyi]|uniref:Uncharacterized protein n=1 Tax=Sphingomonas leidyi TaxID=68569 RepID=A0A7X5ZTM7_9SPHN|nr:hypothetical protein [Sphingomonas leidyi]NIJ63150.1 hypothetical protein [Sphingomonas leidyi]